MVLTAVRKHIRLYGKLLKFSAMTMMTYRISFFVELAVEFGYQIAFILFFYIIYQKVKTVAGWSYWEVILLNGINIIFTESLLATIYVFNLWRLPRRIVTGDLDVVLTKPISSLFEASLFRPYLSSIVSTIPGFYLIVLSLNRLGIHFSLSRAVMAIVMLLFAWVIAYCFSVILSCVAFYFANAHGLTRLSNDVIFTYSDLPHTVYRGFLRVLFFAFIPVVFMSSLPAEALVKGINVNYLLMCAGLAVIFLFITKLVWNVSIKKYSSASS